MYWRVPWAGFGGLVVVRLWYLGGWPAGAYMAEEMERLTCPDSGRKIEPIFWARIWLQMFVPPQWGTRF